MIRYVLCDVDGCLTPEDPVPVDRTALAAVAERNKRVRHENHGAFVTLCTGRPQPFAELLCRLLHIDIPCIAENGVWIYDPVKNRYHIDPAISQADLTAIDACRAWLRDTIAPTLTDGAIQPGKSASISLYASDHDALVAAVPRVREHAERSGWPIRVSMSWYYINCDLTQVSKASGIARWSATLNVNRSELAGIGDTLGDLAIADAVTWFACPANADTRLQPRAAYISPLREAEGVLDILAQLDRR